MRQGAFLSLAVLSTAMVLQSRVITVPDQSPNIQTAIEKAESGDTVSVRIGIWNEAVELKDNIALIGESMLETVIRGKKRKPVVIAANGSLIKNCTVINGRTGILCENVDFTIDQVMVRNNRETGIHCLISLPNIYNSVIYRNKANGILCESARSIKTAIMHNIIAENGYCGIMLRGQSEVLIQNNVFLDNRQYGIWGGAEARRSRIVYNDFFNNRSALNTYLAMDASNTTDNPGYPKRMGEYDFFSTSSIILKGRGKDGATIGLIGGEVLSQRLTDPDEDGVTGDNDRCPSIPEDIDGFKDEDGCPEFDNDEDGIFDAQDACPESPEDYDNFRDDDGCNDFDNDKDGIPDSIDICKGNPETVNGYKDDDGCPDEAPPEIGKSVPSPAPPSEASPAVQTTAPPPAPDAPSESAGSDTVTPMTETPAEKPGAEAASPSTEAPDGRTPAE
ncbi:MAG: right-handed parallel beta-helix repeat-containing protein [Chitinispirillaceae bacterium]|nr:right-handed parallel beta-helix repeat-containing protein [Chitinispirillaceae bacterium]